MLRSFGLPDFYKDKTKQRSNAFALRDILTQYLGKTGDQNLLRFGCFYPFKGRQEEGKLNIEPTAVVLLAPLARLKKSVKIKVGTTIFVFVGFAEQTK